MNNSTCASNSCGLGSNPILLIVIVLLFMPNLFGGCGGCGGSDLFIIIIVLFCFMGGSNLFGIGCGC